MVWFGHFASFILPPLGLFCAYKRNTLGLLILPLPVPQRAKLLQPRWDGAGILLFTIKFAPSCSQHYCVVTNAPQRPLGVTDTIHLLIKTTSGITGARGWGRSIVQKRS